MATLITKAEVIARAFTRQISESRIQEDIVEACQTKYIKPILGEDFYNDVLANPSEYGTLITNYIKPLLAWWVRYMILPELRMELSDLGISTIQVNNAMQADDEHFAEIRDNTRIVAEEKEKLLREYLEDNYASYPLYYPGLDPGNAVKIAGGIVMSEAESRKWIFDDGPEKWT